MKSFVLAACATIMMTGAAIAGESVTTTEIATPAPDAVAVSQPEAAEPAQSTSTARKGCGMSETVYLTN